jgi:hypothetical protein
MSQTALEHSHFPVPMRWPHAGNDPSRAGQRGRRAVRSLIRFRRLLRCLFHASNLACVQILRARPVGVTSTAELGAATPEARLRPDLLLQLPAALSIQPPSGEYCSDSITHPQ